MINGVGQNRRQEKIYNDSSFSAIIQDVADDIEKG